MFGKHKKGERKDTDTAPVTQQPSADFRRAMVDDPEKRRHGDEEHAFTTESQRFNDAPDASEEERGVPPEGGEPVRPTRE
jgi:hypothetical protein